MSTGALIFMGVTWAAVLALAGYCFGKVLFGHGADKDTASPRGKRRPGK